ncbi:MAG: DUF4358 domain-containing protein [Eubacteriales bacterium]|nr:DUF4358 domain-containing protein [Eubacteriales bacterium]
MKHLKLLSIFLLCLLLISCNKKEETNITLNEIYNKITKEVALDEAITMPDSYLQNNLGIPTNELKEYIYSISDNPYSAETIIIINTSGYDKVEELKDTLNMVIENIKFEIENYNKEEYDYVYASKLKQKNDYLYAVLSRNEEEILKIIEDNIN